MTPERLAELKAMAEYGISLNESELAMAVPELIVEIERLRLELVSLLAEATS